MVPPLLMLITSRCTRDFLSGLACLNNKVLHAFQLFRAARLLLSIGKIANAIYRNYRSVPLNYNILTPMHLTLPTVASTAIILRLPSSHISLRAGMDSSRWSRVHPWWALLHLPDLPVLHHSHGRFPVACCNLSIVHRVLLWKFQKIRVAFLAQL